jgi:hypothetical protein
MKMKDLLYAKGLSPAKVTAAYRLHRSTRVVGRLLGLSPKLVAQTIRAAAPALLLPVGGEYGKGKKVPHPLRGSLATWIREHPDVRFPKDLDAIVAMTGCTRDAVKCFLYRQRVAGKPIPILKHGSARRKV